MVDGLNWGEVAAGLTIVIFFTYAVVEYAFLKHDVKILKRWKRKVNKILFDDDDDTDDCPSPPKRFHQDPTPSDRIRQTVQDGINTGKIKLSTRDRDTG